MSHDAARGSRVALDRDRLVRVALALLDEVGLDELSMRRLAERLGVTAAALYWYVRDKNELLGLLADAISAEMPVPDPAQPWRTEIEALARGARRVALTHRDSARILTATLPTGPHRLRAIDALLGLLTHAGFAPADAADAAYVLNVYGLGFMMDETMGPQVGQVDPHARAFASSGDALVGGMTQARLIVERGAVNLTLHAQAALPTLYQVTYEGNAPTIDTRDGSIHIQQRPGRRGSCDLTLAGALTWEILVEGGATRLTTDLVALHLAKLHITGGVSQTMLRLPRPSGTVPLRIDGGVNRLRIERPPKAAVRVYLNRASSHITLDGVRLNAAGGKTEWASPDYATASNRYDLELGGAASEVDISAPELDSAPAEEESVSLEAHLRDWFAAQPPSEYPNLVALADQLAQPDQERRFEVGLQIMLDGLERRLAASGDAGERAGHARQVR